MFQKWVPNIFKRSALSRDLSRALGPRDPPRTPLSTSVQPPGQTFPFPFWSRRRNPRPARWKEGGARSSRGAPHPPIAPSTATRRISHPSIQPSSPHLADTHGRAAAAAAGPSRLVSSLPDLQLLPCRFATFFRALSFSSARSNPPKSEQIFPMIFEL